MKFYNGTDCASGALLQHVVIRGPPNCTEASCKSACYRASNATAQHALSSLNHLNPNNFTLLQSYERGTGDAIRLNISFCEDECGKDCFWLGVAIIENWSTVVSEDTCAAATLAWGDAAPSFYSHIHFQDFAPYADHYSNAIPPAATTTTLSPSEPGPEQADSGDDRIILYAGIGVGVLLFAVVLKVVYSRTHRQTYSLSSPANGYI